MKIRRVATYGPALLASATLALAGCGTASNTGTPAGPGASASPSRAALPPKDAVLASTTVLTQTTYRYTLSSDGLTGTGLADPTAKKTSLSAKGGQGDESVTMDFVLIGDDLWLKMDFGGKNSTLGVPKQFMHLDRAKLKGKGAPGFITDSGDPGESQKLFAGLVDAQRVDDRHYKLTLDLTRATASTVDKELLDKLGDKAKAVPGTATLDDQGRLVETTVDLSAVDPKAAIKITYTDFGAPVTINKPAKSDTVEAPNSVYEIFST